MAEQGTSATVAIISPPTPARMLTPAAAAMMVEYRRQNISAIITGSDSIDMSSITHTSLMVSTMPTATSTVMV